ncbi:hypothetical protein CB1_000692029 [Camelus ferus]|nr:hypothetical protein CB1_000692029 [Camelus ferus]
MEDFDVDHFVSDCRKRVQLEELRADLELYYKLLKTAMVELINRDYADFVNLSTNLVGMDKALNQLSVPLGQLREEVLRIAGITAMLQQSLEGLLLEGLQTSNVDIIRHCLRTYATIDKTRDAEALVGQVLVKPYMDEVIIEQIADTHPGVLQLMYSRLLEFVPHHCRLLREVTGGAISRHREDLVGFGLGTWSSLQRCWSDKMFLPPLAHRLWRLTLQILARYSVFVKEEVPTSASSYVDSALKPFHQLQSGHKDKLKQAIIQQWLEGALSESTHKYYETVSDVLSSVRKMEESLKRLKQARRSAPTNPTGPAGGGMSDDDKIRLQLALDVGYLGEQIQNMGLRTEDLRSFPALAELVAAAKDQATVAEQP